MQTAYIITNYYVFMQVNLKMGLDYSYSQPSQSDDLFGNSDDGGYSETEDLIRRDQAELQARSQVQYPPQPEVEFGFPQTCYCGATPLLATATTRNDPGIVCVCAHIVVTFICVCAHIVVISSDHYLRVCSPHVEDTTHVRTWTMASAMFGNGGMSP